MVDKKRLMATIHMYNPTLPFIANGDRTHGLEFCSKEVAWPESKDYGFGKDNPGVKANDVTTWTGSARHVAIIVGSNWWATPGGKVHFDADTIFRYTVFQAGVCTTGGGVGWDLSPYADGTWEIGALETMKQVNALLSPIAESVKNTQPSLSYPTPEKIPMDKLQHGIVATRSADGKHEYLHVLRPPEEKSLTLPVPKDGRRFVSGSILSSGKPVELNQSDVSLRIAVPDSWDRLDTVIRLTAEEPRAVP
jgi:hypothetical protein